MNIFLNKPFLSKDFSPRSGGIDFLGLRYVNLNMVGNFLITELNNVTSDMGTFLLATWIPWKFKQLCDAHSYTELNYKLFREKIEVALSLTMKDGSGASRAFGVVRNKVGTDQKCVLPCELTFANAKRNPPNSLYAAAIYGPALKALNLISAYDVLAQDSLSTLKITLASVDDDTIKIAQMVDESLKASPIYSKLATLGHNVIEESDIETLGLSGLNPAYFRQARFTELKKCFQNKLLPEKPDSPGYSRTRTTRLLVTTLKQRENIDAFSIRNTWYTGMFDDGSKLIINNSDLKDQGEHWAYFISRQYQRYAIELFLWCFEIALKEGCRNIDDIVKYWSERTLIANRSLKGTLNELLEKIAGDMLGKDDSETSMNWNARVHANHERFENIEAPQDDAACVYGLEMFSAWYWRIVCRDNETYKRLMTLGGTDRMSLKWFLDWLKARKNFHLNDILKDIFSDLIFSQHIRVALSRFDGESQRLRFMLGDAGIEPTVTAFKDLAERGLPWMPDRLDTLIALLCDIDILKKDDQNRISLGPRAATVTL